MSALRRLLAIVSNVVRRASRATAVPRYAVMVSTSFRSEGVGDVAEERETLRRVLEAFNSGDLGRILASTHQDFEGEVPPELSAEPDTYRGHDGMRRYFESFQDAMDEIRFRPERYWEIGESVVLAARITAKGRRTAIPVEQQVALIWTFRDGKALRVRAYASPSEAFAALGLAQ
jgi:ketosteroid isomerase-like protein